MAEIAIWYEGDLSTRAVHPESGTTLLTDAPKDNRGLGRVFSPTDLLAVSLGSCALTLMGIAARRLSIDIKGMRVVVDKEMSSAPPRRISRLRLEFFCPHVFPEEIVKALIEAAEHCPVHHSLHPDTLQEFVFHWGIP